MVATLSSVSFPFGKWADLKGYVIIHYNNNKKPDPPLLLLLAVIAVKLSSLTIKQRTMHAKFLYTGSLCAVKRPIN
jgi:hypothetical protein